MPTQKAAVLSSSIGDTVEVGSGSPINVLFICAGCQDGVREIDDSTNPGVEDHSKPLDREIKTTRAEELRGPKYLADSGSKNHSMALEIPRFS